MKKEKQSSGSAGRREGGIRSDCFVNVTASPARGIRITLQSKVASLYGNSIRSLVKDVLGGLGVLHAEVLIDDQGAVPFVITARVEAAARRALPGLDKAFLPESKYKVKSISRERLRRSRLYLPGNEPHYFLNARLHKPDGIILDLEDSVSPAEKDAARILVRNALLQVDFGEAERMVRINPLPLGLEDLRQIIPCNVHAILIPKCQSAADVQAVEHEINILSSAHRRRHPVFLIPIIESALGVVHAFDIASASASVCALSVGLEDYTADIGVERTKAGSESLFARSAIVNAAKAAGIQALDSVFSDVADDAGLQQSTVEAKALGFDGKGCIHPRQIQIIHDAFAPSVSEIDYAERVMEAFEEAERKGNGVVALGSKMIDAPVVKRARRVLDLAGKRHQ